MHLPLRGLAPLTHVDATLFTLRYPGACMQFHSCHDWCCQFGCDVDLAERDAILSRQDELARFVHAPPQDWFEAEVERDPELPSGACVRSTTVDGACVFRRPLGRGCAIHAWAASEGVDYHAIKPRVCWLFPVCWDRGVLRPSPELTEDLVCRGVGGTVYQAARDELRHAFGEALVAQLDAWETEVAPLRRTA